MIYFVIPARKGSKGFPGKNRKLFAYTYSSIPAKCLDACIVTTDDEEIIKMAKGCKIIKRDEELSGDTISMKDVMLDVVDKINMNDSDTIVLLYLTYPQRTLIDINIALTVFEISKAGSLLCKKEVKTHPYLCINANGEQIIKHDLYRRQDYPKCYEISHFISIFNVGELKFLNNNLYNHETYFHFINDVIDVDYEKDFLRI